MNWFEVDGTNWWKTQNGKDPNNINTTYGGGYKATEFDPFLGFSKNLSPTFPTTAFPAAKFSIVVPEPQTQYSISLVSGSGIATPVQATESSSSNPLPDGQQFGTVPNFIVFNNKPSSSVILEIKHNPTGWTTNYQFNIQQWGVPKTNTSHTLNDVSIHCSTLFKRNELTNSPVTSLISGGNYYSAQTRAIGTFTSEWGEMNTYLGSGIGWGFYWASEQYNTLNQDSVHLTYGASHPLLKTAATNTEGYIFCKE